MFWKKDISKTKKVLSQKKFEREMYIPKKTLQKKERSLVGTNETHKESPKHHWRRIVSAILWILFLLELVYIIFFTGVFLLKQVSITGEPENIHIETFVREKFEGKYLNIFSRNNVLFTKTKKLEKDIEERHPRLQNVAVTKVLPGEIQIVVEAKPYQLLWCKEGRGCFLLNEEGNLESAHVFFEYESEQGTVHRIEDQTQKSIQGNDRVMTGEEVAFLKHIIEEFDFRSGLVREGSIIRPHEYTKEIRIKTTRGFFVYLPTEGDFDTLMSTLRLFLEKEVPEAEWEQIEYIDLRTENRVYYTRKDRKPENPKREAEGAADVEANKQKEDSGNQ